jgi:hypothetical protein
MSNRDETIDRLRGQLQNCVNHLNGVKRRSPSMSERLDACIESANKALYETLHKDSSAAQVQAHQQKAEGKGVCMREEFEKAFPVPRFMSFDESESDYFISEEIIGDLQWENYYKFRGAWEAWQAATALQAERVRELEKALRDLLAYVEDGWGDTESLEGARAHKALSATAREG